MIEHRWPCLESLMKVTDYDVCLLAMRDKDISQLLFEIEDVRMRVEGEAMRRHHFPWEKNN